MDFMQRRSVVDLTRLPDQGLYLLWHYLVPAFVALMIAYWTYVAFRYKRRRRYERRVTGRDGSLAQLLGVRLGKEEKASDWNPAMPAVVVRRLPVEKIVPSMRDPRGKWTYPGGPVGEPHGRPKRARPGENSSPRSTERRRGSTSPSTATA